MAHNLKSTLLFILLSILLSRLPAAAPGLPAQTQSKTALPAKHYNYAAQKKYLPSVLKDIYLGMPFSGFKPMADSAGLDPQNPGLMGPVKYAKFYGERGSNHNPELEVDFFFMGDSLQYYAVPAAQNPLFRMVLTFDDSNMQNFLFETIPEVEAYIDKFRKNSAAKHTYNTHTYADEYRFTSADGMNWEVIFKRNVVELNGRIPGLDAQWLSW